MLRTSKERGESLTADKGPVDHWSQDVPHDVGARHLRRLEHRRSSVGPTRHNRGAHTRATRPRYALAMTIERVFVAGAGLMGHGIAQVHAAIGLSVTLYEPDLARAEAGRDRIAGEPRPRGRQGPADRRGARRHDRPDRTDRRPRAAPPTPISSSKPCSRTSRSSRRSGVSSTASRHRRRSSPRTRRRSRSTASPRRSDTTGAHASSGCTSSARCRSCRSSS